MWGVIDLDMTKVEETKISEVAAVAVTTRRTQMFGVHK